MAGDPAIAATTLTVPHPYPDGAAEEWIGRHAAWAKSGEAYTFAIADLFSKNLLGCISMDITAQYRRGMLGYWIGKEYWSRGFCTEATRRVIQFGFEDLDLLKVYAFHHADNPASGKVMKNSGMEKEGFLRSHIIKDGVPIDCVYYGIVRNV